MSLSTEEIESVRKSFDIAYENKDEVAEIFYNKLFQLNPSYKELFKGDMKEQGRKLMVTLKILVAGLDNLSSIVPAIQDLGRRHVRYGVKDADYPFVGEALIYTFEKGLGDLFTPSLKKAWSDIYAIVSEIAIAAAKEERK